MPRHLTRYSSLLLCAAALAVGVSSSGCAETAAAAGTAQASILAAEAAANIPLWVQQAADAVLANSSRNWGKPEAVVETETSYVLLYPTTDAQRKANGGVPRMIVIERTAAPAETL